MATNVEKVIFKLFDEIKRYQINIDESLAITLALIYNIYEKKEEFIAKIEPKSEDPIENFNNGIDWITDYINNDFNAGFITQKTSEFIINNIRSYSTFAVVTKPVIKKGIKKLIEEKALLLEPSNRMTAKLTTNIISSVAKKLSPNGNYIDLAIGTGNILSNLNGEMHGIDINPKMVIISCIYLFFCDKIQKLEPHPWNSNIVQSDAIEDYVDLDSKNTFVTIFDPPMGDLRAYPKDKRWQDSDIIGTKKPNRLQSEILFLMSFLINSNENDYFIGLFPENILTKNNNDYNSLRKYLINNSLIAVIKVLTNHILLIGKNKLDVDKYPEIPVIRIQNELNDEQINYIANEIIKGKNIDFEKYYIIKPSSYGNIIKEYNSIESYNKDYRSITTLIYNRNDLLNGNAINLPREISYENTYANSTKTPKEILVDIQINEEKIKTNLQKLAIINKFDNLIAQEKVFSPWFINKTMDDMHVALNYFYSNYYSDILTENNIEGFFDFQVKNNITKETFLNLKILFENKRIQLSTTKVKIYFGKDKKNLQKDINWSEFYDLFNPFEEEEIKNILKLIKNDPQIKLIFENLCQYWMLDQDEEKTLLKQKKYKVKDFVRCLKVLENLGLVFFNKKKVLSSNEGHSEIDLYKRYIPNIKYLDAIKFKENQDV